MSTQQEGQPVIPQDTRDLLGKVVMYDHHLARIVGVSEGRTLHIEFVEEPPCPACGNQPGIAVLAHAPLFYEHAKPVETLEFM